VDDKGIRDYSSHQEIKPKISNSNSPHDPVLSEQPLCISTDTSPHAPEKPGTSLNDAAEKSQTIAITRKDKRRLHSMHHAILSRYPLEALARLGENIRQLRSLERNLRRELKPSGLTGDVVFDRMWSSYLRCLLAAKAEATAFTLIDGLSSQTRCTVSLKEEEVPTLVLQDPVITSEALSPDLLKQLVLVARYDRHFANEMYRALGMLLALRTSDQVGSEEKCADHVPREQSENPEGS
jgi:hypothetical protein